MAHRRQNNHGKSRLGSLIAMLSKRQPVQVVSFSIAGCVAQMQGTTEIKQVYEIPGVWRLSKYVRILLYAQPRKNCIDMRSLPWSLKSVTREFQDRRLYALVSPDAVAHDCYCRGCGSLPTMLVEETDSAYTSHRESADRYCTRPYLRKSGGSPKKFSCGSEDIPNPRWWDSGKRGDKYAETDRPTFCTLAAHKC